MEIAIASGKGGTGKTLVATNLALQMKHMGLGVTYLDCDVETPNGHLFLKPQDISEETVTIKAPLWVDEERCTGCGICVDACRFNALALIKEKVLFFRELCHVCGACTLLCPEAAIVEGDRDIGTLLAGHYKGLPLHYGLLKTGEGGMTPRMIKLVKKKARGEIAILDAPPGTTCPAVETVRDSHLSLLIADPTPFGLHDLKLSVDMCRLLKKEPTVIINRAEYDSKEIKDFCHRAGLLVLGEIPYDGQIAAAYSRGELILKTLPHYGPLFADLAHKALELGKSPKRVQSIHLSSPLPTTSSSLHTEQAETIPRELVVISGKGGTGKTSLLGAFIHLAGTTVAVDCDVDAANLHLILKPDIEKKGGFSGGVLASIDTHLCTGCGNCEEYCRFGAVHRDREGSFYIEPLLCEGCGVCTWVCTEGAIQVKEAIHGQWFLSRMEQGRLAHARLGIAEENSGRLVSLNREHGAILAATQHTEDVLIDGSPGTGCPVIASLTGARYALVVTEPTVSGLHDLKRILSLTAFFSLPTGVVVNKSDINTSMTHTIKQFVQEEKLDFLGTIPYDPIITRAQMQQCPVTEYAPQDKISLTIQKIWNRVKKRMAALT